MAPAPGSKCVVGIFGAWNTKHIKQEGAREGWQVLAHQPWRTTSLLLLPVRIACVLRAHVTVHTPGQAQGRPAKKGDGYLTILGVGGGHVA